MKAHETTDGSLMRKVRKKRAFLKNNIIFTKEPQSDDVTDTQGMADGTETDAQMLSDENKQILEALDANGEPNKASDKPKKGKKPKKKKKPKT